MTTTNTLFLTFVRCDDTRWCSIRNVMFYLTWISLRNGCEMPSQRNEKKYSVLATGRSGYAWTWTAITLKHSLTYPSPIRNIFCSLSAGRPVMSMTLAAYDNLHLGALLTLPTVRDPLIAHSSRHACSAIFADAERSTAGRRYLVESVSGEEIDIVIVHIFLCVSDYFTIFRNHRKWWLRNSAF